LKILCYFQQERMKWNVSANLNWKLDQRNEMLFKQGSIAVRHEIETVYVDWLAFMPTSENTV